MLLRVWRIWSNKRARAKVIKNKRLRLVELEDKIAKCPGWGAYLGALNEEACSIRSYLKWVDGGEKKKS